MGQTVLALIDQSAVSASRNLAVRGPDDSLSYGELSAVAERLARSAGAQLIVRLEELFGVEITLRYLFDHPTVAEITAEVERQMAGDQVEAG